MKATFVDVRHAYRLMLGREPDPSGIESFERLLAEQRVSTEDVAAMIAASPEYKARHEAAPSMDEIDFDGLKLYPWRGDSLIGGAVKSLGTYEPHVLPRFVESIPAGGTVLDVGANIGIFTLSAARKVGVTGHVFAIEPIARNVQSICAGIVGNGFHNVSVLPVAASGGVGVVPMLRNSNSSNGIVDVQVPREMADAFVPTQRIDFLVQGIERLDVVKIDIEGHEPIAWPGLASLIRKFRPVVFTEFSPVAIRNHSRVEPETYLQALFEQGDVIRIVGGDGTCCPCDSAEQVMKEWRRVNEIAGTEGTVHLDLIMDPRSAF